MNLCGQPLSRLISSSSTMTTSTPSILLLHDDLEKKFAQLSFKFQGSANGHNGVASVHSFVGRHVHRLRIGIGRPPTRTSDVIQKYVLSPFTRLEMKFFESEGFLSIWRAILDWTNEIKLKNSS
ncbi:hypothetical protein HMI55_003329 [Coelomomyces lativittatus]|nr:hypothetical protein HMI55_003329 [Coelomomyces lativittatus]